MKFTKNKRIFHRRSNDLIDALRGIQRGLDSMAEGKGKPFREALDEIRARYKIPKASR